MGNGKKLGLFDKLWFWLIVFMFLMGIVCFFPYLFTSRSLVGLDFNKTGSIGDTIGGIMGPFIAMIASFMTFIAFWEQYRFNKEQILRFNKQEEDLKIERFENKFYELLKLHRENVAEFEISRNDEKGTLKGKRIFVEMFEELKLAYLAVQFSNTKLIKEGEIKDGDFSKTDIYKLAYLIFFNGFSRKPTTTIEAPNELWEFQILESKFNPLLNEVFKALESIRSQMKQTDLKFITLSSENYYDIVAKYRITYKLFRGHHSRLGHYFRGLFQLVSFVIEFDDRIINNKYSYIKTLRAQLSNHEQLLLYYNALSVFGSPWIEKKYLSEWKMISNMPIALADFYIKPKELFNEKNSKGEFIFEFDEIVQRK